MGAGRQAGGSAEVDEAVSVTLRLIDRLKRADEEACMLCVDGRMHMHRRETMCCRRAIQIDAGACSSTVEADQDVGNPGLPGRRSSKRKVSCTHLHAKKIGMMIVERVKE